MRHSKRTKLTPEDINFTLQQFNFETLYGHSNSTEVPKFLRAQDHKDLFFLESKDIDFGAILSSELPLCPKECTVDVHWLAIDGIQPTIPQNPDQKYDQPEPSKKRKVDPELGPVPGMTQRISIFSH